MDFGIGNSCHADRPTAARRDKVCRRLRTERQASAGAVAAKVSGTIRPATPIAHHGDRRRSDFVREDLGPHLGAVACDQNVEADSVGSSPTGIRARGTVAASSRAGDSLRWRGIDLTRRRRQCWRARVWHDFRPLASGHSIAWQSRNPGMGRLDASRRRDCAAAGRVSYSSNLDQRNSSSVSRHSQAARANRRERHRVVRRDANRESVQPAKTRGGSFYNREQPDGAAGTLRMVVDARRGNGLGDAHSHRQRRASLLRRMSRPRRSHDRRRSHDVPGLSADAAGTARDARAKRHPVSKQPERTRPSARSVGRNSRDAFGTRCTEGGSTLD